MRWGAPSAGVVPSACPRLPRGRWHSHPPPPPMVKGGGGGVGAVVWGAGGRPGLTERAGILRKPDASHKPFDGGRVPAITPYTQP